jgi:DNA-binding SARP family transcriptional activator
MLPASVQWPAPEPPAAAALSDVSPTLGLGPPAAAEVSERRSAPEAPRLQIRLLGTPEVLLDWVPLTFARRRTVGMLAFLAVSGRPCSREALMALLTTDHAGERASKHISNSLTELRQELGAYIHADRHSISLSSSLPYSLDTRDLEGALRTPLDDAGVDVLHGLTDLYRGEFLEGLVLRGVAEFEDWQARESARLRAAYVRVLRATASGALKERRYEPGLEATDRLLALEPWDEEAVRLSMTLHTRAGDRLQAQAVYDRYRSRLREELEDAPEPRTTQLYRAIRAASVLPPTNLPAVPRIIGRAREVERLTQLLASRDSRVVNLVGLDGSGKTRVALEVALHYATGLGVHEQPFSDGVFFAYVAGAPSDNPPTEQPAAPAVTLAAQVCSQLGIHTTKGEQADQALLRALRDKTALLVLDGADSALNELSALVFRLAEARHLMILVTSRQRIDIGADDVAEVAGLEFGDDWRGIETTDAGALFLREAARTAGPIELHDADRRALARICHETGGHPLALIMAAERCKTMGIEEIGLAVAKSTDFLQSEGRGGEPPRRLSALIESAIARVETREQEALRRLAVMAGTFTSQAADVVARISHDELALLRDAGLITAPTPGTYRVLALVRRQVLERAPLDAKTAEELRARHAWFYARALLQRAFGLMHAVDSTRAMALPERDDLIAAGTWAATRLQLDVLAEIRQGIIVWSDLSGRCDETVEVLTAIEEGLSSAAERLPDDPVVPFALYQARLDTAGQLLRLGQRELAAVRMPTADQVAHGAASTEMATSRHLTRGEKALEAGDPQTASEHFGEALGLAMSSRAPIAAAVSAGKLGAAFWLTRRRAEGAESPREGDDLSPPAPERTGMRLRTA